MMRWTVLMVCSLTLLLPLAAGCVDVTTRGPEGERMTATLPQSVTIQRGQTQVVKIGLERKNSTAGVNVAVSQLPSGVEAEVPAKPVETDQATILLKAAKSADLVRNQAVKVTLTGPNDTQATQYFQLTVTE